MNISDENTEKYFKGPCSRMGKDKLREMFLDNQEEIWEANFIVFNKYFINEKDDENNLIKLFGDSLTKEVILNDNYPTTKIKLFYDFLTKENKSADNKIIIELSLTSLPKVKLSDAKKEEKLLDLPPSEYKIKNELNYHQWRTRHILDYFLYKEWYKNKVEDKDKFIFN
uniref:Uncharacterized protein n=1 Tax=Meloidogyne hapla TaxID=6305 RepID=A0A1I8AZ90_MELHA